MFRSIFSRAVKLVVPFQTLTLSKLIDEESLVGGKLFGRLGSGVSRRFFMDDGDSWFYSETAIDPSTKQQLYSFTIRYQVLPQGILKSVDGRGHVFIKGIELERLLKSMELYKQRIEKEVYEPKQVKTSRASA